MLSKKQITRAVTFISMSVLTGLSSAVSAGLVPDDSPLAPDLIEAQAATTEDSSHPIADEMGIKTLKKKKVMYAKCTDKSTYLYYDAKVDNNNRVGFGGSVYLAPYQKVTVLANVGSDWYLVKFRCFHHDSGKFTQEKAFIQRNRLKSKLTAFEKESVKMLKDMGFDHVEDDLYNAVIYN